VQSVHCASVCSFLYDSNNLAAAFKVESFSSFLFTVLSAFRRSLNYSWEPVPIGQRFLGSLRLWKVVRHEKCQFSPRSLRAGFRCYAGLRGTCRPKTTFTRNRFRMEEAKRNVLLFLIDMVCRKCYITVGG
jgi:hypothetical protein